MRVYSNAFNFDSYISGGVDLRTGQYSSMIRLATIAPEGPLDNSRDITLTFSMMEESNSGYGLGWTLGGSDFNVHTRQLRLISGQTYVSQPLSMAPGSQLRFVDRRLNDLVVRTIDTDTLHVIHKDGLVEVLRRTVVNGPIFRLSQFIFENGERFRFAYAANNVLASITHEQSGRIMLTMQYFNGMLESADALQEQGRIARSRFTYVNGQLRTVSIPFEIGAVNPAVFSYQYQNTSNNFLTITRLSNPMGGEDFVRYEENGHNFLDNLRLPFVNRLESFSGGGAPLIIHRYNYSQNNFTGFPFGGRFNPAEDNMYLNIAEYNYWGRDETLDNAGNVLQTKLNTYNRFHLLTNEQTTRAGLRFEKTYSYNELANQAFSNQPSNLHLPRQIVTRYQVISGGANRQEVETITTDNFGNELSRVEANGIRHEYEYYPIGGSTNRCPPEPHGLFQRFVSDERIRPASGNEAPKLTTHTYIDLRNLGASGPYVVSASSVFANVLTHQSSYQTSATAALHGRLSESRVILNSLTTRTQFTYQLTADVLTETRRVIGFDNSFLSCTRASSVVNQRLISMRKDDDVSVTFSYDINGRVTVETVAPGTANQAQRRYTYHFASTGNAARVVTNDSLNGQFVNRYNGFGEHISSAQVRGNAEEIIRTSAYNHLRQLVSESVIDRIAGTSRTLVTSYTYNGWGQITQTRRPDGSVEVDDYDPIGRVHLQGGAGVTIRTHDNQFEKGARVERVGTGNQTLNLGTRNFDGFGRCVSETDANGHRTDYRYDIFDRVTSEIFTPAGSGVARTIINTYAAHAVGSLKTAITVNQVLIGRRAYDGVGRLITQHRGSSQSPMSLTYVNGSTRISSVRLPSGVVQDYQHNVQLNEISQIRVANQTNNFGFEAASGSLISAVNSESNRTLQYDEYGRIRQDTQSINGQSHNNTYNYSPAGRLTSLNSAMGDAENRSYDTFGRFASANITGGAGAVQVAAAYDGVGRISTLSAVANNDTFASTLTYDMFGREAVRRITRNNAAFQTITLTYHSDDKLASRHIVDASQAALSGETFAYDVYGRLTSYICAGPQYAIDQRGRSIQSQQFSYDALNNMTQAVTSFVGGGSDVATRSFGASDPTQLRQITSTNPPQTIVLAYDANGNLASEGIRIFSFDGMGRLVNIADGANTSSYGYDATGRQIRQSAANVAALGLHYSEEKNIGVSQGGSRARYVRHQQTVLARSISAIGTELNVNDASASVRTVRASNNSVRRVQYAPYGLSNIDVGSESATLLERNRPGFNGERYDPLGRLYHLGNGLRAYSPELMVFLSPDPSSPFAEGGINSYAYCGGDPINFIDPSGMSRLRTWLLVGVGIALLALTIVTGGAAIVATAGLAGVVLKVGLAASVISVGLNIASASVSEIDAINGTDNSRVAYWLSMGSLVFGVVSFGVGAAGITAAAKSSIALTKAARGLQAKRFSGASRTSRSGSNLRYANSARGSAYKIGARHFLNGFSGTDHAAGMGRVISRTVLSVTSLVEGTQGIGFGLRDAIQNFPHYSSSEQDGLFASAVGSIDDVVASLYRFHNEFNEQAAQIRSSAIFDAYSSA